MRYILRNVIWQCYECIIIKMHRENNNGGEEFTTMHEKEN